MRGTLHPIIQSMRSLRGEDGIVVDWLVKIVIVLGVLGVIGYDVGSILVNRVTLDGSADDMAVALSLVFQNAPASEFTTDEVFRETKTLLETEHDGAGGAKVVRRGTFLDPQGVVHVKLRRKADTLIAKYISFFDDWVRATGEGTAGTN